MATPRLAALKAAPSMAEFLHRQQVFSLYRQVFRKSRHLIKENLTKKTFFFNQNTSSDTTHSHLKTDTDNNISRK
jgi:hypothetical protein